MPVHLQPGGCPHAAGLGPRLRLGLSFSPEWKAVLGRQLRLWRRQEGGLPGPAEWGEGPVREMAALWGGMGADREGETAGSGAP